jgi:hypothetical protein
LKGGVEIIVIVDQKKWLMQTLAIFAFIVLSTSSIHAAIIDSTGGVSAGTVNAFGAPDTQSMGQTFIAPSADTLSNNFSLYHSDRWTGSGTPTTMFLVGSGLAGWLATAGGG